MNEIDRMASEICELYDTCSNGCPLKVSLGHHACSRHERSDDQIIVKAYDRLFPAMLESDILSVFND